MSIDRKMSQQTWEEIRALVGRIMQRAAKAGDDETVRDADRITALMRNLSAEIGIEDRKAQSN